MKKNIYAGIALLIGNLIFAQSAFSASFGPSNSAAKQTLVKMQQTNWTCLEEADRQNPEKLIKTGNLITEYSRFWSHPAEYAHAVYGIDDASIILGRPLNPGQTEPWGKCRVLTAFENGFVLVTGAENFYTEPVIFKCRFDN